MDWKKDITILGGFALLALVLVGAMTLFSTTANKGQQPQAIPSVSATPGALETVPAFSESDAPEPCSGLPEGQREECLSAVSAPVDSGPSASSDEAPEPCSGLPDEQKGECMASVQPSGSSSSSNEAPEPCSGLPDDLRQECLAAIGG